MEKEVKKLLKKHSKEFMSKNKINWGNIQDNNIKEKFGIPVSWRTLYKLIKDPKYKSMHVNTQSDLLTFFNVTHEKQFGNIILKENNENE